MTGKLKVPELFCVIVLIYCSMIDNSWAKNGCVGRPVNPVTDVCWSCLLPIKIAGVNITGGDIDTPTSKSILCACSRPGIPVPVPGIPIAFWEPARLVDVTKSPMCMVSLGGISLGSSSVKGFKEDREGEAFYHVHWYIYPVIYWLEILLDFVCLEMASVDVAYMTEFDPMWSDDAKTAILNPETLMFGNPLTQAACVADCATSSTGLSNDSMFWCAGCQGGIYPYSGTTSSHNGGVGTAQLIVSKFMAKMHRQMMLWGYYGKEGMCGKYPMPVIKKSQYRLQMTYPVPEFSSCKRIGQTEVLWQSGKEYPIFGEDYGFLIWRKRDCCLL